MRVGVLGATGMVGQRFIQLLVKHPWFKLAQLAASERSAGKKYVDAANWYFKDMPSSVRDKIVVTYDKLDVDIVFSALPSNIAREVESKIAENTPVFSNASAFRMENDVPLIIPEVNPEQSKLVKTQKKRGWKGFIVTNPNCCVIPLAITLKPLLDNFGLRAVKVATLQALSGAGIPGVPSMSITDNIIPYIAKEEEKIEAETIKILAKKFDISPTCNRVSTIDGHLECVFVKPEKRASIEGVKDAFKSFTGLPQKLKLPTAPNPPIVVRDEVDRPQPRMDRDAGNGMAVSVGRIRSDYDGFKYLALAHNTIRGAAGASVLNAELFYKEGLI